MLQLETVHSQVVTPGRPVAGLDGTLLLFRERSSQVQIRNGPGSDSSCKPSVVPSLEAPVRILSRVRPLCGASQAGATLPFSNMQCTAWGPPGPSHCGTVRICESCVRRSRPDAQHCRPSQLYCRGVARAEG